MKCHQALAEAFVAEGARAIFSLMGDATMHWLPHFTSSPVKVYDVRHENAGLAMADGWARATGETGICAVTSGPGLSQIATSLLVASRAHTPLVVFTASAGEGRIQQLDHRRFAEASESGFVRLESPDDAYKIVRKAFHQARLEARPVILDAPGSLQNADVDDLGTYQPSASLFPPDQHIVPSAARLEQAAKIVAESRKPVIIAGRGAAASGAGEAVLRLAHRSGALIATTLLNHGWLAGDPFHAGVAGLFATRATNQMFVEADCVIGVGASLNDYTIESGYLFADARFVHIDIRPSAIMGSGRVADCYVQADARPAVEALEALLAERGFQSTGFRTPETRAALDAEIDPAVFEPHPGTVDPRSAALSLEELVPGDNPLVIGLGHFMSYPVMYMKRPRPFAMILPQFGCIGQALGTAIGAAVAAGRPTVCIDGDASVMMHIQELDTIARYGIPLLVVIMNDQAWGAEYHRMRASGMDERLAEIRTPDLGAVARAFGCRGALAQTLGEFRAALQEFRERPGPMLIDLRVSKVPSVPYRRLLFGEVA